MDQLQSLYLSSCRALLVQFGFYMHIQHTLGTTHYIMSRPVVFASSFMLAFSIVIALFKDIPDVKGDRQVMMIETDDVTLCSSVA